MSANQKQSVQGAHEVVRQSIYDTNVLATGTGTTIAATTLTYFAVPVSGMFPTAAINKTYLDTNLETAGQLPFASANLVGIRFYPHTRTAVPITTIDFNNIVNNCYLELKKEDRLILRTPLSDVPAGFGISGSSGGALTSPDIVSNGMPMKSNFYDVFTEPFLKSDRLQLQIILPNSLTAVTTATNFYLRIEFECEIGKVYR